MTKTMMNDRNTRDVVPELRAEAERLRAWFAVRPGMEGRLLRDEIAANEIERLRKRVLPECEGIGGYR